MTKRKTQAWVISRASKGDASPGGLTLEDVEFEVASPDDVIVEPLFGCWEANMTHAISRWPVDICRLRREEKVILGNAGIVRIAELFQTNSALNEGDLCLYFPQGLEDGSGYTISVAGYDAKGSMGLLAKRLIAKTSQLIALPSSLTEFAPQMSAFPIRYLAAWSNWKVAYACWRVQMDAPSEHPIVWGWGGGVSLGELLLAKAMGCTAAMIASGSNRLNLLNALGITAIDRREFDELDYCPSLYDSDISYKSRYLRAEGKFLDIVKEKTNQCGVSIFIDNIGTSTSRATLRAIGRQGVVTTTGWKEGKEIVLDRARECIGRHIHVHTHGARRSEATAAVEYAVRNHWIPPIIDEIYRWEDIPILADDYANSRLKGYFPLFSVNEF